MAELLTALLALLGGALGGLLGVGGGIVFVPALVIVLDVTQVEAEATSLLAIVPVALVGTWRQHRLGNVRLRDGLILGLLSIPGVAVGVLVANAVPERALELGFAGLILFVAAQLARRSLRPRPPAPDAAPVGGDVP
jgi:uncharacterized protein